MNHKLFQAKQIKVNLQTYQKENGFLKKRKEKNLKSTKPKIPT